MTMTPEGRAAAVINRIERDGYRFLDDFSWHNESTLTSYIALAIREAEDAALERAAAVAFSCSPEHCEDEWQTGWAQAAESIASDIRSLKHNKD